MEVLTTTPPKAPKPEYISKHKSRWEKEKIAAGDEHAFDSPDDPEMLGNWQLGEMVGKGASGRVKIARHRATGELAAVKILPKGDFEKQKTSVEREIVLMKLMEHPNVLSLYDVWEGKNDLYLIFEFVKGGELFDYIVNRGRLDAVEAASWFKQIISGLAYTHSLGVSHRDLKPENLLIASVNPPILKIADWGMAAFTPPTHSLHTSCGSPHYASPQIVNGEPYDGRTSDIWSCGVILYALLTGRLPFDDRNVKVLLGKVRTGKYEMPDYIVEEGQDLIRKMLAVNVEDRITMPQIIEHPFLKLDTPLIEFTLPPPLGELARPVPVEMIYKEGNASDMMHSLMIIWRGRADEKQLREELMSPERNASKAFYWLLEKYREKRLERYGMEDEYVFGFIDRIKEGTSDTRPYQLRFPEERRSQSSTGLLPDTPPQLSSMNSTLVAFDLLGRDDGEPDSPSARRNSRGRFSFEKHRIPRAMPVSARVTSLKQEVMADVTDQLNHGGLDENAKPRRASAPASQSPGAAGDRPGFDVFVDPAAAGVGGVRPPRIPEPAVVIDSKGIGAVSGGRRSSGGGKENIDENRMGTGGTIRTNTPPPRPSSLPKPTIPYSSRVAPTRNIAGAAEGVVGRVLVGDAVVGKVTIREPPGVGRKVEGERAVRGKPPGLDLSFLSGPSAPAASNVHASGRKVPKSRIGSARPSISHKIPATANASVVATIPVTGFFANLFHWRPQVYKLNSSESLAVTKKELEGLFIKHGVIVEKVEKDMWKCWVQPAYDFSGVITQKEVKFRVEFAGLSEAEGTPPWGDVESPTTGEDYHLRSSRKASKSGPPSPPLVQAICKISMIQERGALSTFKIVYGLVKDQWRFWPASAPTPSGY